MVYRRGAPAHPKGGCAQGARGEGNRGKRDSRKRDLAQGEAARPLARRGRFRRRGPARALGAGAAHRLRRERSAVRARRADTHPRPRGVRNAQDDRRSRAQGAAARGPGRAPVHLRLRHRAEARARGRAGDVAREARDPADDRRRRRPRPGARRGARAPPDQPGAAGGEGRMQRRDRARVRVGHRLRPLAAGGAPRPDRRALRQPRAGVVVQLPARPRRDAPGCKGGGRAPAGRERPQAGRRRGAARQRRAARPLRGPQPVRLPAPHRRAGSAFRRAGEGSGPPRRARDRRPRQRRVRQAARAAGAAADVPRRDLLHHRHGCAAHPSRPERLGAQPPRRVALRARAALRAAAGRAAVPGRLPDRGVPRHDDGARARAEVAGAGARQRMAGRQLRAHRGRALE